MNDVKALTPEEALRGLVHAVGDYKWMNSPRNGHGVCTLCNAPEGVSHADDHACGKLETAFDAAIATLRVADTTPEDGHDHKPDCGCLPIRVVIDQHGHYWRDYGDHWSMCPVSTENVATTPVTEFYRFGEGGDFDGDPETLALAATTELRPRAATPAAPEARAEMAGAAAMPLPWDGHQQKLARNALRRALAAPEALVRDTIWMRDDCQCSTVSPDGDGCFLSADYTTGLCAHCQGHAALASPDADTTGQPCPICGHPHGPLPEPWLASDGHLVEPRCDWPMGPESCDCRGNDDRGLALASQRSDGLGRSERAEERQTPIAPDADTTGQRETPAEDDVRPTTLRNARWLALLVSPSHDPEAQAKAREWADEWFAALPATERGGIDRDALIAAMVAAGFDGDDPPGGSPTHALLTWADAILTEFPGGTPAAKPGYLTKEQSDQYRRDFRPAAPETLAGLTLFNCATCWDLIHRSHPNGQPDHASPDADTTGRVPGWWDALTQEQTPEVRSNVEADTTGQRETCPVSGSPNCPCGLPATERSGIDVE